MSNRILLVEDDQSFGAVILKIILSINNFDVTLAIDGELGLKRIHRKGI